MANRRHQARADLNSPRLTLGVDFGSSAAKGVLADEWGTVVARAVVPQTVARPTAGAAVQDAEMWWTALRALVAATLGTLPEVDRRTLAGLAISGHYPTLLLSDGRGDPLAPAMLYGDRRADGHVAQGAELGGDALVGDEWLPKLLWLQAEAPDLLQRTRMVFNPHDHVAFRLTGRRGLDHRSARRSGGLFDPVALAWRPEVARAAGLAPSALPPLRRSGEVLGPVTPIAAASVGLPVGTPVVVGLGDTPAELIGAGVVHAGDVLLYYGTTTTVDVCSHDFEAFLRDPAPIVDWAPYHEVGYAVIGPALPWVAAGLDPAAGDEQLAEISRLDALAAAQTPSLDSPYVVPYFLAHARPGTSVRRPAIIGLDANHSRIDLHRAVLESFGFLARVGLEAEGIDPQGVRFVATGGGARSEPWRQIMSDVLGSSQVWRRSADAALGSAALAAWATCDSTVFSEDGWTARLDAPATQADSERHPMEDARYRAWLGFRDALAR